MKHFAITFLIVTTVFLHSFAQQTAVIQIETKAPSELGFSTDSLEGIPIIFEDYIQKGLLPGATILIARHGQIAYEKAFGFNDIENGIPAKTDNIYRIASMTKPIVSAAVLQLYEAGKLDLQDPLSKYIPEFANVEVLKSFNAADTSWTSEPLNQPITLHHLLTHTSGISYGFTNATFGAIYGKLKVPDAANPFDFTIHQALKALARAPLAHQPGQRWTYGLSTDILGAVVEIVSGKTLDKYVQDHILTPLGMSRTGFWLPEHLEKELVAFYMPQGDTAIIRIPSEGRGFFKPDYPISGAKKYHSGGSGLSSNLRDYFVFSQTIANGGIYKGKRILKESSVELMRNNQAESLQNSPFGFGYGYGLATRDSNDFRQVKKGKYSWGGAFNTTFWIDPVRDIIVVWMSQVLSNPHKNTIDAKIEAAVNRALVNDDK